MSTAYEIRDFMNRVQKYVGEKNSQEITNIADMIHIIPHATTMMPWVHVTKEWEVMAHENVLTLTGILAPRLFANILVSNGHMKILLSEMDEMAEPDNFEEHHEKILNVVLTVQEANIIGGVSKLLNAYLHRVSLGVRRHFTSYSTVEFDPEHYKNDFDDTDYVFVNGTQLWVAPNKQTFYDTSESKWIHLRGEAMADAINNSVIMLDSAVTSQPLPPLECV